MRRFVSIAESGDNLRGGLALRGVRFARRTLRDLALYLPRQCFGTITHVATSEPVVSLTFDDGPHPEYTRRLLEILAGYNAKATFFVIGESVFRHPELVHKIAAAGHAIGNHSWGHRSLPLIGSRERRQQMQACEELIAPYSQKLFRPPYGNQILVSRIDAWRLGFQVIAWNLTGMDWRNDGAQTLFARISARLKPGSIILLHDALFDAEEEKFTARDETLGAVELLLERYRKIYQFVTVPELLQCGRPVKTWWYQPGDAGYLASLRRPQS